MGDPTSLGKPQLDCCWASPSRNRSGRYYHLSPSHAVPQSQNGPDPFEPSPVPSSVMTARASINPKRPRLTPQRRSTTSAPQSSGVCCKCMCACVCVHEGIGVGMGEDVGVDGRAGGCAGGRVGLRVHRVGVGCGGGLPAAFSAAPCLCRASASKCLSSCCCASATRFLGGGSWAKTDDLSSHLIRDGS